MAGLIVITGPPGAGKSTVAELLVDQYDPSALVPGDQFFGFLRGGWLPPWMPEADDQNHAVTQAAAAAAGRLTAGGYTVVYDGVVGPWAIAEFTTWTGLEQLHYALLMPSEDRCVDRVQQRVGHGFTDVAATRHMYRQFAETTVDVRHLIDVGSEPTPERTATAIRERVIEGSLLHHP